MNLKWSTNLFVMVYKFALIPYVKYTDCGVHLTLLRTCGVSYAIKIMKKFSTLSAKFIVKGQQ